MFRIVVFCTTLFLLTLNFGLSFGQTPVEFKNLPFYIEKPQWLNLIDWNKPNIFFIDSLFSNWKSNKNNFISDTSFNEDPFESAFFRWRNRIEPYIIENGDTSLNEYNKLVEKYDTKSNVNNVDNQKSLSVGNGNWTFVGPSKTYSNGRKVPWQSNVYQLVIDKNNPNNIYCGTETGNLYKSNDKGKNWFSIGDNILSNNSSVTALAISTINPQELYSCFNNGLLFKSANSGISWQRILNYNFGASECIEVNEFTNTIFIASNFGVVKSEDGGTTFKIVAGTDSIKIYDIKSDVKDKNIIFAIGSDKAGKVVLLKSINGGTTFVNKTNPIFDFKNTGSRLTNTIANNNVVYCVVLTDSFPKILKSTNSGEAWVIVASSTAKGLVGSNINLGLGMSNGQGFYDLDICVSPTNENELIVGTTTAFKSIDGGYNFKPIGGYFGNFNIHPDIQSIRSYNGDTYITTDGGVNYSSDFFTNITNYESRTDGIESSDFWGFGQGWDEDILVGGRYHNGNTALFENYKSGNSLRLGGGEDATGHVFHGFSRLTGFRDIGLVKIPDSLNGQFGNTEINNTKWPSEDFYGQFSSRLVIDPRYRNIYYLGNNKDLWKTIDNGKSYTILYSFQSNIWRFDISRTNPNVIIACTTTGIFKSTDAGISWTLKSLPSGVNYAYYNSDIVINPSNENNIYFTMSSNSISSNRVFQSNDGGDTWSNITLTALNGLKVAYLQSDGSNDNGVYAITNFPGKIFYKNKNMVDWVDFSNRLPLNISARQGGIIFFRDNKIRICGNRGFWESPLYIAPNPIAQPMVFFNTNGCSKDTVRFFDYSILNPIGAKWNWEFPGANQVFDANTKSPKVLYSNIGKYDVKLTVTDSLGRISTKLVKNMIDFNYDICSFDTLPGLALNVRKDSTVIDFGKASLFSNSFSISCWVKPNGMQKSFAQLVSHDKYPGSNYGFGLGFAFKNYVKNLNLCYTDNIVGFGNSSNLVLDSTKWNFITLVYAPDGVTLFLNGNPEKVVSSNMPKIDLSQTPFYINKDIHNQGGYFSGILDEIKIYNYSLSVAEVREKMHLIQKDGINEKGLLKYLQFNKYNGTSLYELVNNTRIDMSANNIVKSTVPIGLGVFYKFAQISSQGDYSFPNMGLTFKIRNNLFATTELYGYKLNNVPDTLPLNKLKNFSSYWIFNSFGNSKNSLKIDSIKFDNLNITNPTVTKNHFLFYNRKFNDYGPNWRLIKKGADNYVYNYPQNNSLSINTLDTITNFGQILIIDSSFVDTSFKLINKSSLCIGDSVNIILKGGNKYQWFKDGNKVTFPNDTLLTIKESGLYRCLIISPTNFIDTTSIINIFFNKVPSIPVILRDSLIYLKSNNSFGNLWYKEGILISDTTFRIKPITQGSYTAKTMQNGCTSSMSTPYYFIVTNLINLGSSEFIKLAPNPVKNHLNIDFVVKGYQRLNVDFYELSTGLLKYSNKGVFAGSQLLIGQLSPGTYVVNVRSDDGKIAHKLKIVKL
jgi:hypothetical protein